MFVLFLFAIVYNRGLTSVYGKCIRKELLKYGKMISVFLLK